LDGNGSREAVRSAVTDHLEALSDRELHGLVEEAPVHGSGIGGVSRVLDLDGGSAFVKVVPLTARERHPDALRSTGNLFGLPPYLQYGVGSPGFTAWRELEALERTTRWVRAGDVVGFPLLYHWRVLRMEVPDPVQGLGDRDEVVAHWHGAAGLADRLGELASCEAGLVLFLERVPHQLDEWLSGRLGADRERADAAIEMVDATLLEPVAAMNRRGLYHFDTHLRNLLTDGERVLVADFGLATATDFDLDAAERRFLGAHHLHDLAYAVTKFVNLLVSELVGIADPAARNAYVADHASPPRPPGLPAVAAGVVRRYAPVAAVVNSFYWRLHTEARDLPFPIDPLERAAVRSALPRLEG
jgi:hypothetical protein